MSIRDPFINTGQYGDQCSQPINLTTPLHGLGFQPNTIIIKNNSNNTLGSTTVNNGGSVLTSNTITGTGWIKQDISAHGIHVNGDAKIIGDAEIEGDLTIKGESITGLLEDIKDRLAILRPNEDLESRWDQLRDLRRQYIEMEKDILEKEEILRILKE